MPLARGLEKNRTVLGVPLLREGSSSASWWRRGQRWSFTDKQIELVTTFADQAVIAIENVRLFEAEQARTRELTEALEQQTATSEVLRVISSSSGELAPVFESLLASADTSVRRRVRHHFAPRRRCVSHRGLARRDGRIH